MEIDNLVRMANRIGHFFEAWPNHAEAVAGVQEHVAKFWETRMRRQIYAHLDAGGSGLSDLLFEALNAGRARLCPDPKQLQ